LPSLAELLSDVPPAGAAPAPQATQTLAQACDVIIDHLAAPEKSDSDKRAHVDAALAQLRAASVVERK
jgi:hypothetical protein